MFYFKKQNKKVERKDLVFTRKNLVIFLFNVYPVLQSQFEENTNTILFVTDGNIVSIMDLQALPRIVFYIFIHNLY